MLLNKDNLCDDVAQVILFYEIQECVNREMKRRLTYAQVYESLEYHYQEYGIN